MPSSTFGLRYHGIKASRNNAHLHLIAVFRWIKFEEKVEKGGERWSKPHVATLSLHSLMELKAFIEKGTVKLDMEGTTLPQVVGKQTLLRDIHKKTTTSKKPLS